jgi:DNA-binding FadR family transcriptional regulator
MTEPGLEAMVQHSRSGCLGEAGRNRTYSLLDSLGKAIVTGQFDSHAFPTEADLARQYAVSRSVTREAVKMLTAKGLLTARPRTGTVVQPPGHWNLFDPDVLRWLLERKFSLELLRQFTELRIAIEPAASALAARAASTEEVAKIRLGYERMEAAEATDDDPLEADIAFHLAILRGSGNPFYAQFQNTVSTALRTSIRFTNRLKARTASVPQHEAVLRAIEAREPDLAQQAMFDLINDVRALITGSEGMN